MATKNYLHNFMRVHGHCFFGADYSGRKLSSLFDIGCKESTMPMPLMFLVHGAFVDGKKFCIDNV